MFDHLVLFFGSRYFPKNTAVPCKSHHRSKIIAFNWCFCLSLACFFVRIAFIVYRIDCALLSSRRQRTVGGLSFIDRNSEPLSFCSCCCSTRNVSIILLIQDHFRRLRFFPLHVRFIFGFAILFYQFWVTGFRRKLFVRRFTWYDKYDLWLFYLSIM